MQITEHVYARHIDDKAVAHPGGSNIFFVGDPKDEMVIIDAGDQAKEWRDEIFEEYQQLGRPKISSILITHGHGDHIGGLDRMVDYVDAPVRCHPKLVKRLGELIGKERVTKLKAGEIIRSGGGVTLRSIFTPGHEEDHVCYYLSKDKVMFTGDTILGASSSTVRDLSDYMKSLDKINRYGVQTICPAHGPVVPSPRGSRLISWYIRHRNEREAQILGALNKGITDVDEMVKDIYPKNLKKGLRHAAARNVSPHLAKLVKEGVVSEVPSAYTLKKG